MTTATRDIALFSCALWRRHGPQAAEVARTRSAKLKAVGDWEGAGVWTMVGGQILGISSGQPCPADLTCHHKCEHVRLVFCAGRG